MNNQKEQTSDEAMSAKWSELLNIFKKLIENNPPPEKIKIELIALKEKAKSSIELTSRQVEAILARADNYLNGTYGNTKTTANLSYGATPTTPPKQ